jgi:acyl-CoA thioesterase FadM
MAIVPPYLTIVAPDWIDYNGHMTEGFYGMVFADATDAMLHHIGMDANYRAADRGTMFTVETHIRFLRELKVQEDLRIEVSVLGNDAKRVHLWAEMHAPDYLAATQEVLLVHVIPSTTRVGAMDASMVEALSEHRIADVPTGAGRSIRSLKSP